MAKPVVGQAATEISSGCLCRYQFTDPKTILLFNRIFAARLEISCLCH